MTNDSMFLESTPRIKSVETSAKCSLKIDPTLIIKGGENSLIDGQFDEMFACELKSETEDQFLRLMNCEFSSTEKLYDEL